MCYSEGVGKVQLQDVLRQKRTEIDAINGAIVNEAGKAGIEAPVNETLTYLVKGIEQTTRDGQETVIVYEQSSKRS